MLANEYASTRALVDAAFAAGVLVGDFFAAMANSATTGAGGWVLGAGLVCSVGLELR